MIGLNENDKLLKIYNFHVNYIKLLEYMREAVSPKYIKTGKTLALIKLSARVIKYSWCQTSAGDLTGSVYGSKNNRPRLDLGTTVRGRKKCGCLGVAKWLDGERGAAAL